MENKAILDIFLNEQVVFLVDSRKVYEGDVRLDSTYFVNKSNDNINVEILKKPLIEFVQSIDEPKLFSRIYCDKKYGIPYISSSEMSEIGPQINSRFISRTLTNNISQYIIKRGQILVSAAGTVGTIVLATQELDEVAGTSDILRINTNEKSYLGLIYTYLSSDFGANELTNIAYGAIIKRIRGFHLESLKIPIISSDINKELNDLILKALDCRDIANDLIKKARSLVLQYNNLPLLDDTELETLDPEKETDINLVSTNEFTQDYRLDAHFYNPMADLAVRNIKGYSANFQRAEELVNDIILGKRFKRNYVESNHGTPFLSGKNIIQIRPDVKYLSNTEISFMDELLIKKNWILITCSGTIGRTCFVYNNYENYAASQHILRVVPNEVAIDPGYLYCFLSTDYGFHQILRYKYGAVIDEIDDGNITNILIPICSPEQQKEIGDLVRQAYDLRAEAIRLEDEAQEILTKALTGRERVL